MNPVDREEAMKLLQRAGCQQNVIDHCLRVSAVAVEIAQACLQNGAGIDIRLVEIGAILHDIGRSVTHGIDHGVVGSILLEKYGLPPEVRSIVEKHIGAGISEEDARELGLPPKDYVPRSLEEKVVAYADKLVDGEKRVPLEDTLVKYSVELGKDHPSIGRLRALEIEITSLAHIT